MLPVNVVTPPPTESAAPTTPFTPGPNAGRFWWVRTVSPPRTTTSTIATTTTTISTAPTTTTPRIYGALTKSCKYALLLCAIIFVCLRYILLSIYSLTCVSLSCQLAAQGQRG